MGYRVFAAEEDAAQVHRLHPVPLGDPCLSYPRCEVDRRVVYEDVEPGEPSDGLADSGLNYGFL